MNRLPRATKVGLSAGVAKLSQARERNARNIESHGSMVGHLDRRKVKVRVDVDSLSLVCG
jgi:hypothetical protein